MNIVLIGYGKMGQTIKRLCLQQGHSIHGIIDIDTTAENRMKIYGEADVAIEFSHPDAAYENVKEAISAGIPVVSGTTGWLNKFDEISLLVKEKKGAFFYASNFSVGVNIMFAMNEKLASIMNQFPYYNVSLEETHHIHKKDAPSGTAITLAEGLVTNVERISGWSLEDNKPQSVAIEAKRIGEVFGIHKVSYHSEIDTIQLYHEAFSRDGFASGAIMAAQWLVDKKGVFAMKDMLGL